MSKEKSALGNILGRLKMWLNEQQTFHIKTDQYSHIIRWVGKYFFGEDLRVKPNPDD